MADQSLIDGVRAFAARELAPAAREVDRSTELPHDRWAKLGESGLAGMPIAQAWGGLGADRATVLGALESVAAACSSTAWALLSHFTVATGIAALGSDAQKKRYLGALAQAQLVGGALASTETGGGSNAAAIRTFARAEDGGWVLDGSKFFITQAGVGDVYLVMARTDRAPGPRALSCFVVERTDAGLSFGEREQTMGMRGVQVREVFLDHCRLGADRLLGEVGGGLALIGAVSGVSVLGAAAGALGVAQAALDATLAHLKQRKVLDQPLAAIPAIQGRIARVVLELDGARALLGRALEWLQGGAQGAPLPVWLAKVAATEAAVRVADDCMALHGAAGYSQSLPLERQCRDVRAFGIHWGNNDVLMDMAGKAILA